MNECAKPITKEWLCMGRFERVRRIGDISIIFNGHKSNRHGFMVWMNFGNYIRPFEHVTTQSQLQMLCQLTNGASIEDYLQMQIQDCRTES